MSKKVYEKAANIARAHWREVEAHQGDGRDIAQAVEDSFAMLFADDNPHYDATRFRAACRPAPASPPIRRTASGLFDDGLHKRIATVLKWPLRDVQSMSLASLRDLVRPVDAALAADIARVIHGGQYLK